MNRRNPKLYLLAAMILAAACGRERHQSFGDGATAQITRSWPAASIHMLRVREIDGSVTVEASPTNEITLTATARGDLEIDKHAENSGLFETRIDGDMLRIGRRERHAGHFKIAFLFGDDDVRIDYVLRVPPSVELDVGTVNGRIALHGGEGRTEAATVNGTIDIETAGTEELQATTVNGRVRAKFLRSFSGARFKTVNGGVEALLPEGASFSVDLAQVNGDFEASFPLSIHSNPGTRRVSGDVNGGQHELKIVTVNGDVELGKLQAR
jgi:hypothetical protein